MPKALLATEDVACSEIMEAEISSQGYDVVVADNGKDAYDLTLSESPDIVFLDMPLPVFDGLETCRMLREDPDVPRTLPIIFLTTLDTDQRRIKSAGATDSLPKTHEAWEIQDLLVRYMDAILPE